MERKQRLKMLWQLAEYLEAAAQDIRYADKPADLTFPQDRLIDLSTKTRNLKMEWLETHLKLNPKDRGQWPHL